MLTLWAIFNIVFFLDVSSVLAEIPASRKLWWEAFNQPPCKMGLEGVMGAQKSWGFKAPPWFEDPGPRVLPSPPLSFTYEFTLAGPCLLPVITFNGLSFPVILHVSVEKLVSEKLGDLVRLRLWRSKIPDRALCSSYRAKVTSHVVSWWSCTTLSQASEAQRW